MVHRLSSKFKTLGKNEQVVAHEEFTRLTLKYKVRDNNLHMVKLRRRRDWLRSIIEAALGNRSARYRTLMDEVKNNVIKIRMDLKVKNKRTL